MRILNFFFLLFYVSQLNGQNTYFTAPVKIPLLLSGSFAELRSNHFHSGIDIKTQGIKGIPVYSVADGYISRISVSPGGFGNALYINHPNGTTTVYGHLDSFRKDLAQYVKNIQYDKKLFKIDIQPDRTQFTVKQDEQIALSGNSGSSGGPHLHFEIRNTNTEEPVNPLLYNFAIKDNTPPKIFSLLVVPLNKTAQINGQNKRKIYPAVLYDGKYHLKNNPVILAGGQIGFAIRANDYFDNSWNKCGIYSMELIVDDELIFSCRMNRFSFDETRYINAYIVYEQYKRSRQRFQKTWVEPGNKLQIYGYLKENGVLNLSDKKTHKVKIILKDVSGNPSSLDFTITGKPAEVKTTKTASTAFFKFNQSNFWETVDFSIKLQENSFYNNLDFVYKKSKYKDEFYSDVHVIHQNTTPLQKSADIAILTKNLPEELRSKALLVNIDTISGKYYAAGGDFQNGWVVASIRDFGNYVVSVDTIQPNITPLSIKDKTTLTESDRIRFKISDNLAGINTIEGFIDNNWVLFEYDAKSSLITHYFDPEKMEYNKQHHLVLKISDYRNNSTFYEASFRK